MAKTVNDIFGTSNLDAAEVKTSYESNADTNAFTDADQANVALLDDLGTFTGSTITDNTDLETALQELETAVEAPLSSAVVISFFAQKPYGTNEILGSALCADDYTLPAGLAASSAYAEVAPTDAVTLDIKKNGVTIGSVDFAAGQNTGTLDTSVLNTVNTGDRISLVYSGAADATIDGISVTLRGDI